MLFILFVTLLFQNCDSVLDELQEIDGNSDKVGEIEELILEIPQESFLAKYYQGTNFDSLVSYRLESNIDYYFENEPISGLSKDNFSIIWTGDFFFDQGSYDFNVVADDGIKLWINDELILDKWIDQAPTEYIVKKELSGSNRVRVEYYDKGGAGTAKIGWDLSENQGVDDSDGGSNGSSIIPSAKDIHNYNFKYDWKSLEFEKPIVIENSNEDVIRISNRNFYYGQTELLQKYDWGYGSYVSKPLIEVKTDKKVIIENCVLVSPGDFIHAYHVKANVEIRNCVFVGLTPTIDQRPTGITLMAADFKNVVFENNYIENARGLLFQESQGGEISVMYNKIQNIDGRYRNITSIPSNQTGCMGPAKLCSNFVQLRSVKSENVNISWNEVMNYPDESSVEDIINIYNSEGTSSKPMIISNNFFYGTWSFPFASKNSHHTGSAFTTDGERGGNFVNVLDNTFVVPKGINIASGHDNKIDNNRKISSELLPNGSSYLPSAGGINVFDWQNTGNVKNNSVSNNFVLMKKYYSIYLISNNTQANNEIKSGATLFDEQHEFELWLDKLRSEEILLGPTDN